jgi:hypothetical protein
LITNHTELLNALAEKYGLNNYLEIGVQSKSQNYNKIICQNKTGVDPAVLEPGIKRMTSDEYFAAIENNDSKPVFDLIFIDGLHHADQVKRDFENSLKYLSDTGYIVIHDVLPENEAGTKVPRETKQWWGDVYKFVMNLDCYTGIRWKTFNIDNGCCMVWKVYVPTEFKYDWKDFNWNNYMNEINRGVLNISDAVKI